MSNITLNPNSGTCIAGGANCSTLGTPPAGSGQCDEVLVSGLPTNVSFTVTANGFNPCGSGDYYNAGTNTFTLTFSASSTATPGTYTLGVSSTLYPNSVTYTLTVAGGGGSGGSTGGGGFSASVNLGTITTGASVVVEYSGLNSSPVVPTDSEGNTYTLRSSGNDGAGGDFWYWYDCINATGGSNFTVTVNLVSHTLHGMACKAYTGIVAGDTFSLWSAFGTSTSPTITPTHAQLILVGESSNSAVSNGGSTPSSGWSDTASDGSSVQMSGNLVSTLGTWKVNYGNSPTAIGSYWAPATWIIVAPAAQVPTPSGSSATFSITTTSLDNVTLSYVSGLPTGAGQSFNVNPIVSGTGTTLTITTERITPYGVYTVNFSGTDGNTTFDFSVLLFVTGVLAPRWIHT